MVVRLYGLHCISLFFKTCITAFNILLKAMAKPSYKVSCNLSGSLSGYNVGMTMYSSLRQGGFKM